MIYHLFSRRSFDSEKLALSARICRQSLVMLCLSLLYCLPLKAQNPAEDFKKITGDGAWCWFSDPRVIYYQGNYFGGYVDSVGSIWSFSYNPENQEVKHIKQFDKLEYDDHANPSIAALPDGRLITFFTTHGGDHKMHYRISKKKYDVSEWEEPQIIDNMETGSYGITYSNLAVLSEEKNRLYVFYRGNNFKPNFKFTDDYKTWSEGKTLIVKDKNEKNGGYGRPYLKMANNGKNTIHFAFTTGHPRNEYTNSLYYLRYKDGYFENAAGKRAGTMKDLPFDHSQADLVYDASKNLHRAWVWDIAYDENDYPIIAYTQFESELKHEYWYARWDGEKWLNYKIDRAGRWFPRRDIPKESWEGEPHYSGGMHLDHNNPNVIYASVPVNDVFEIHKYETKDMGKTWAKSAVTQNSALDNVRPFVPLHDPEGKVMWMYNYSYPGFKDYQTAIRVNDVDKGWDESLAQEPVKAVMKAVADWQIADMNKKYDNDPDLGWITSTFYYGLSQYLDVAPDKSYYDWLYRIGHRSNWQPSTRMYHADDIVVSQSYIELSKRSKNNQDILIPTIARVDWVMDNLENVGTTSDVKDFTKERWNWCDALFMAPPVYAGLYNTTGDKKYIDFMDREFKLTASHLYDKKEKLFYRDLRFPGKTEKNGEKIFWGRGNGWVVAGLVNILKNLPKGDKYRPYYEDLLVDMCTRLAPLQDKDGYWHASLLDPVTYHSPETSSTGFITYALAYGVNEGLLKRKKFEPVVQKGWKALVKAVNTEGKLGYVQPVGSAPKEVTKDMTHIYGPGGFLMAGTEILKMIK